MMEDMIAAIEANDIHPVVDNEIFSFEQAKEAYQYMASFRQQCGVEFPHTKDVLKNCAGGRGALRQGGHPGQWECTGGMCLSSTDSAVKRGRGGNGCQEKQPLHCVHRMMTTANCIGLPHVLFAIDLR